MLNSLIRSGIDQDDPESIGLALAAIRKHLGMEIAYLSEFVDDRSIFREVDAPGLEALIKVGDSNALDDVYCRHILEGRLPELMADTADHPVAVAMPITQAVPIGAHMSVPLRLADGEVFGMFCCLSPNANRSLNDRDLGVMRVFADMVAGQLSRRRVSVERVRTMHLRVEHAIDHNEFNMLLQPIWQYGATHPSGFEALTRFSPQPYRAPDVWFKEAAQVDEGVRLEIAALAAALALLAQLPGHVYLSVNASPATILNPDLPRLLTMYPLNRIVLEVTEHAAIDDYPAIASTLAPLRAAGLRLAVDDAGAGFASFQHILRLAPDIIKLDMGLTRGVDTDLPRRSLASAMILFASETQCTVVAEGIETESEWQALRLIGIDHGQGFFLGRPGDLASALALLS